MAYIDWLWSGDLVINPRGDVALAKDLEVVRQDLLARLISPRGSHWAFPAEGSQVPDYVQVTDDALTRLELRQEAELTCLEDVRVLEARTELTSSGLRIIAELDQVLLEFDLSL